VGKIAAFTPAVIEICIAALKIAAIAAIAAIFHSRYTTLLTVVFIFQLFIYSSYGVILKDDDVFLNDVE
jgi:hypothetical protein